MTLMPLLTVFHYRAELAEQLLLIGTISYGEPQGGSIVGLT